MRKGEQTRVHILGSALEMAAREGLEGLTIGSLAERLEMSKSGVFSHFGSREELQIAVLRHYEQRFIAQVLVPAVKQPRGLPRLRALLLKWLEQTVQESNEGCLWISGASEYDGRPGPVRDELVRMVRAWQGEIGKAIRLAQAEAHLELACDVDQLHFEIHGVVLVLHHDAKLLANPQSLARAVRVMESILTRVATANGVGLLQAIPADALLSPALSSPLTTTSSVLN